MKRNDGVTDHFRELTVSQVQAIGTKLYACLFTSTVVEYVTYENA